MGPVDYERAWREIRRVVLEKPSHGQRDLLAHMARIETDSERDQSAYERFAREFSDEIAEALTNTTRGQRAADERPDGALAMPEKPHRRSPTRHEGAHDGQQRPHPGTSGRVAAQRAA